MTIDDWFTWATADAARRGLSSLTPLLEGLRHATRELREADWNDDPRPSSAPGSTPRPVTRAPSAS